MALALATVRAFALTLTLTLALTLALTLNPKTHPNPKTRTRTRTRTRIRAPTLPGDGRHRADLHDAAQAQPGEVGRVPAIWPRHAWSVGVERGVEPCGSLGPGLGLHV